MTTIYVFTTLLKKLSEKNNLLSQHAVTPSATVALLQKEFFLTSQVLNNSALTKKNPHHWQPHLSLNTQTEEQIRIYSLS